MVVLYRSGGLLPAAELRNSSAVWFDAHSVNHLASEYMPVVGRCSAVFASFLPEDAFMWAERRGYAGRDATIYEIDVPDDANVLAYRYKFYDDAVRAAERGDDFQWYINAYWLSNVNPNHWFKMWTQWFEGYENSQEWEVIIPVDVAGTAKWSVYMSHDEVADRFHTFADMWDTPTG